MQRKMKLVHKLLEHLERRHDDDPIPLPEIDGYSEEQVHYHVGLCVEAGYLVAGPATSTPEGRRRAAPAPPAEIELGQSPPQVPHTPFPCRNPVFRWIRAYARPARFNRGFS